MNKFFLYLILLIFLSNCGLVKKDIVEEGESCPVVKVNPNHIEIGSEKYTKEDRDKLRKKLNDMIAAKKRKEASKRKTKRMNKK